MAKITAPLLSLSARGTIAETITFSAWRGVDYARQRVVPANPKTTAQELTRDTFALLREMWKLNGTIGRAPWDAFAKGRKFTGMNSFVGENLRVLRPETDMLKFIGSPGAAGGISFPSISVTTGAGSGEIDVALTAPTLPTGWSITQAGFIAFPEQAPDGIFEGPLQNASTMSAPWETTFTGFTASDDIIASGWFEYEKPDGFPAYSVGLTDTATAGA